MSEATLNELLAEQGFLKSRTAMLKAQRAELPRNDKAGAHALLVEINRLEAQTRDMRPAIARAREREERQEQHSLWCACIVATYGQEALAECFEWMQQERKRRRASHE
jgi:hypothetical protein